MKLAYRFLPDVALADIAFSANGDSPSALFESCARALTSVMVDPRTVHPTTTRVVLIEADDIDGLLYDFLTRLIIMKDVDSLLFRTFKPRVSRDMRSVACGMRGEPIERGRQRLRNDVKAVTMHMFGVKHERGRWRATVVLDI